METLCEHCRRECWIEDDRAGEGVICPWCEKTFVAKEPPERLTTFASMVESLLTEKESKVEEADTSAPSPQADTALGTLPRRRKRKPAPTHRWPQVTAVSVLAMAVVVAGAVAANRWYASPQRSASAETDPDSVTWLPDPLLVDQLAGWKKFDRFEFRPPKSFARLNVLPQPGWLPHDGHFAGLKFQGDGGDRAEIYCHVVTFPPLSPMRGGLEEALDRFYGWMDHHATVMGLSHGEREMNVLNGRTCIRSSFFCRLRKRESLKGEPREGVVYVMIDKDRQVTFYTLCDPKLQDVHNLMGASLLTWREQ